MFFKWIVVFLVLNVVDASFWPRRCSMPRLTNGRVRGRSSRRLVRFSCDYGFELVGSRYATCASGNWDAPIPVCVRPGCEVPEIQNGLRIESMEKAWLVFFCLPGFQMHGSSVMYCDGRQWNTTAPACNAENVQPKLSCDFEDPDLCGWNHDVLHDFDWLRLNRRTPSSFLLTGPSYDHTSGEGGAGYYMYIEGTGKQENATARLISPIFDKNLTKNGCFVFYFHMFGRDIGGLRVYQKRDSAPLSNANLLFEKWGNQGDVWWGDVATLSLMDEDFQIVIEGIRGKQYASDIAIDDVAILQGDKCAETKKTIPTARQLGSESCEGRCYERSIRSEDCGCYESCVEDKNCCFDFFDYCWHEKDFATTEEESTTTEELPQTQKLIANTSLSTTTTTTTTTTPKPEPPKVSVTVLIQKPTEPPPKPKPKVVPSPLPTVVTPKAKTYENRTIFQKDAISPKNDTANTTITEKPKVVVPPTVVTTTKPTTVKVTTKIVAPVVPKVRTPKMASPGPKWAGKKEKEAKIQGSQPQVKPKSSAWRPVLITLAVLLCIAGAGWACIAARGARARLTFTGLRARARRDPEVRYLHTDCSDD